MWVMNWGLVGDIGATNARFALVTPGGELTPPRNYLCSDYATIGEAIATYLATSDGGHPERAVLAVAASLHGDRVTFTNNPWSFSMAELRQSLGLDRLRVINDFHANALAVPQLAADDLRKVGGGEPVPEHADGHSRTWVRARRQRRCAVARRVSAHRRRGRPRHHGCCRR